MFKGIGKDFDWEFLDCYFKEGIGLILLDMSMGDGIFILQYMVDCLWLGVGDKFFIFFVISCYEQLECCFMVEGIYCIGLEEYDW